MHAFVEETNLSFLDFVIHNKQKDTNFVLLKTIQIASFEQHKWFSITLHFDEMKSVQVFDHSEYDCESEIWFANVF